MLWQPVTAGQQRGLFSEASSPRCRGLIGGLCILVTIALTASCGPARIARVPVPQEDILKANEAAREADLAFLRKDYYAALIKYLEAGRLNPNSEYIFNKIGIAYSQLQFYPEAINAFERSIGLNPKYPYSFNNLGSVYFATNDKGKAEKHFKKAISINSEVASFHINLGTLYFERKKFDKGMEEWRKGLALDPNIMRRDEGISIVAAGSLGSTTEKSYFMARLYASVGDVERAIENLQEALNGGFSDINAIRTEPDFDPIRNHQSFQAFMRMADLLSRP